MVRTLGTVVMAAAMLAGGCVPSEFLQIDPPASGAVIVPNSPFTTPAPVLAKYTDPSKLPAAAPEFSILVDKVGRELIAANAPIGIRPVFSTIGAAQPEIFHQDTSAVFITEGLVKLCKTEGQLAAVLSVELGRVVSERELLAIPETHNPEKPLPITVTIGNAGQFSGLEQLQQEEIAKLNCDRPRPKRFVPPDPGVLARGYLEAAGFDKKELDAAAPLLAQADKNFIIEKQFKGPGDTPMWAPH